MFYDKETKYFTACTQYTLPRARTKLTTMVLWGGGGRIQWTMDCVASGVNKGNAFCVVGWKGTIQ